MLKTILLFTLLFLFSPGNQVFSQAVLPAGYSDRSPSLDVLPGFIDPPKGYGEVPFYWWQGDPLTRERIEWQLDQLEDKSISSLQINYSHLDSGGVSYGLSNPSEPALFSDEWWDLFRWFAAEAQKRGMTVSLSDYTLGVGQGFSMDEAREAFPELNGTELKADIDTVTGIVERKVRSGILNITASKINPDKSRDPSSRIDLLPFVKDGVLHYDFGDEKYELTCVYKKRIVPSYDPMHPQSGKAYNQYFFDRIKKELQPESADALNFFFSDELDFRLGWRIWNDYFAEEFEQRKGYDVVPYLDALFTDIGDITPKIRLDYNDVVVQLSEEHFFIPVYEWHQSRGLIFGCDHGGRGKKVDEFGDYFRTQRWNQGPGSDQPRLSKDIIKAKVAASIAHLYGRPRVWLEGFYGSGWGTSSAGVTDAIFGNYVAGYNLMSFHGLYYSTQGGWWEWAPPDNHFRMPYGEHMGPLMKCVERLSYLLSQGHHVCDVAILYPTEPVVAGMDGRASVKTAFNAANVIYDKGIDFDFIDFESIARAEAKGGSLRVAGEHYKAIVVPSMKVMRFSTLKKLEAFKNAGGMIINIGALPDASDKSGSNDEELNRLVSEIFINNLNAIQCANANDVPAALARLQDLHFRILSEIKERPYVMHRKAGNRELYAVYNVPENTRCFFRAKGALELWNPWNGEVVSMDVFAKETEEGTEVTLPLSKTEIQLIVFNPESQETKPALEKLRPVKHVEQTEIAGNWEFELKPSLDNRWGDYQLPASDELIGAQVRQLHLKENADYSGQKLNTRKWDRVTCGYGTHFLTLGPLPNLPAESELRQLIPKDSEEPVTIQDKAYAWKEYRYSWKQGVEGDYGHQGYHGLKGEMYDDFIRLGALKEEKHSLIRAPEEKGNFYVLFSNVLAPHDGEFDLLVGDKEPSFLFVNDEKINSQAQAVSLRKGENTVLAVYDTACETFLVFRNPEIKRPEPQALSMRWYQDDGVLPFDCSSATQSTSGLYSFQSAPGLQVFTFSAYGNVNIWVDGRAIKPKVLGEQTDGLTAYKAVVTEPRTTPSQVVIKIEYKPGYTQGAAIPEFIKQECGRGEIALTDWSKIDGLTAYSGGAYYRKTIEVDEKPTGGKTYIDLGEVVSSAELSVNGKSAGIRVAPPLRFDVTHLIEKGENTIEVLVYNTLSNNFTGVPTRYKGSAKSGLIGPVSLVTETF